MTSGYFSGVDLAPTAGLPNTPLTAVIPIAKPIVNYTSCSLVFSSLVDGHRDAVCHFDEIQRQIQDKTADHFFTHYAFRGVTVGDRGPVGAREISVVVGNFCTLRNVWGSGIQPCDRLGLRLSRESVVGPHVMMKTTSPLILSLATFGKHNKRSASTDPASKEVSWFCPLFECLTSDGRFITATFLHGGFLSERDDV